MASAGSNRRDRRTLAHDLRWLTDAGIDCLLSDPGKPWQNGHEAVPIIEAWRQRYNEVRPHSSLDYVTPIEFKTESIDTTTQPTGADSRESTGPENPGRSSPGGMH